MKLVSLHDRGELERFFRRNTFLHIYSIGDLDDFFWPDTVWYGLADGDRLHEVVLVYTALSTPVLIALSENSERMGELLRSVMKLLPRRIYAHLSPGLARVLEGEYRIESHGTYYKLGLMTDGRLGDADTSHVVPLDESDRADLQSLYDESYPANSFDSRMLETGQYFGVRRDGRLVGAGGVHVYSATHRVAAIGNVVTHLEHRGQGIATAVCARLCRSLLERVDHVGLNVKADNRSAIHAYERLGFERVATYEECSLELKCT